MGDKPAGTIATEALYATAERCRDSYPEAADMIRDSTYMDDLIDSCEGASRGIKLAEDVSTVMGTGNFRIKGWRFTGGNGTGSSVPLLPSGGDSVRVLGMLWDNVADEFHYRVKINFSKKKKGVRMEPDVRCQDLGASLPATLTRRLVLEQVMGIFDPYGFLVPFTMKAKFLLRETWIWRLGWDDPLPEVLRQKWEEFFSGMYGIEELAISRCVKPRGAVGAPIMITFSDGSEKGYGAAAYLRWDLEGGGAKSSLVLAKGRVAPVKRITVPRLELNGAVVAKRIRRF
ncbi:PREDICTED: uncharacterized protein LOC106816842 [Priapulus caudatus]|uniref:Uncharacterized protein LOC106816842 n=1 Tax=Priapulus caudatus TaxID=37621 RepID=A0ABM1EXP2_PRICU|nr:PREDICTED: uncharacterized protein LOC106816842 [Priapulus caudatus]